MVCGGTCTVLIPLIAVVPAVIQVVADEDSWDASAVAAQELPIIAGHSKAGIDVLITVVPTVVHAFTCVDSGDTPELHVLPPVQDDRDVLAELDGVMQAEQAKRKLADEIFAGDKQRMLDVEKSELRRIIREVLA